MIDLLQKKCAEELGGFGSDQTWSNSRIQEYFNFININDEIDVMYFDHVYSDYDHYLTTMASGVSLDDFRIHINKKVWEKVKNTVQEVLNHLCRYKNCKEGNFNEYYVFISQALGSELSSLMWALEGVTDIKLAVLMANNWSGLASHERLFLYHQIRNTYPYDHSNPKSKWRQINYMIMSGEYNG